MRDDTRASGTECGCSSCGHAGHGPDHGASSLRRELVLLGSAIILGSFAFFGLPSLGLQGAAGGFLLPGTALAAYLVAGWHVLAQAARNIARGRIFDELFLMSIATLGAFAIGQYEEALGVMVFYKIGEMLQDSASEKSRASVRELLALRPDVARLRRGESWVLLSPEEAAVGERFMVMPGERLPLDGRVLEGEAFVDTSALTGESLPRRAAPGTELLAGSVALDGSLVLDSTRPAGESSAARIAELVENASHAKARSERFVTRFAAVYTPIVCALAAVVAFLPPLVLPGASLRDWLYRALVMLVISCPCALVISVPLGYFGGLGGAARRGILVKGSTVLDALAKARTAVFDKTGTLTEGKFRVLSIEPMPGTEEDALLSLAAAAESRSLHPIAASIREASAARGLSVGTEDEASEIREVAGAGVVATIGGRRVLAGNERLLQLEAVPHDSRGIEGTTVDVAADGVYLGRILVGDLAKPDAAEAVEGLAALGVGRAVMLTGDAARAAAPIGAELGIGEVHAGLLPEGKLEKLERIIAETRATGGTTIFVGDGINDSPALALADVGIAMGAGADVAVESADVVLMTGEPSRVAEAVARARRTRRIVIQNIVFALGIKAAFLVLGAAGAAVMWEAVIADVGVALLATANSLRAMR
ncbi:MAG TPA: heavy metal translocating P-type ATPase [Spirochaetales bacterium]|nr:heavy metal translocating P-type ATPase [Spirochaetales bacterium]HRY53980.1 heavy metal translocating P-type ATPase [Spirochaetia bacterium]HRZ65120.1 heavy metal translocating P-type ATPase [Spirochaetia bacterium]